MKLSKRLKTIVDLIDPNMKVADIGTDHGYIPIYLIKNGISDFVIASDINKGPINILLNNLKEHGVEKGVYERLGSGLKTINENEVDVVIIAGMGGNLISDIIDESMNIVKSLKYMILQPAQHEDVLREYLFNNEFKILEENVVLDSDKYYHTMKVTIGTDAPYEKKVYYYTGKGELKTKTEDFKGYVNRKIESIEKILNFTEKGKDKSRYADVSGRRAF